MGLDESNVSFLRTSSHFHNALANLEPQVFVAVEHIRAERYLAAQRGETFFHCLSILAVAHIPII